MKLWNKSAAAEWQEGMPICTGHLVGLVLEIWKQERIAMNHEWQMTRINYFSV
ncbi:MAG: hypothetical protein IZT55_05915 [Anaerolineae bacterium]|nr:hypothetical protein [Anaerolineae bacterium]